jgi:hypothetical protein
VASLSDFSNAFGGAPTGSPLGFQFATMTPQYRLNETGPALQEDAGIATSRALQNYTQRQLPQLANTGAAMGQTGSSGLANRANFLSQDTGNQVSDIQRMLARNTANIAQQRVMATMGGMF